jgi:hypothetical protein
VAPAGEWKSAGQCSSSEVSALFLHPRCDYNPRVHSDLFALQFRTVEVQVFQLIKWYACVTIKMHV